MLLGWRTPTFLLGLGAPVVSAREVLVRASLAFALLQPDLLLHLLQVPVLDGLEGRNETFLKLDPLTEEQVRSISYTEPAGLCAFLLLLTERELRLPTRRLHRLTVVLFYSEPRPKTWMRSRFREGRGEEEGGSVSLRV